MKKQPLKEMLKAIGGEHLLNENKLQDYWEEITNEMEGQKIGKFWADVDMHTGGLSWGERNSDFHIYATPAWEGKKYIEFEEGMTVGLLLFAVGIFAYFLSKISEVITEFSK